MLVLATAAHQAAKSDSYWLFFALVALIGVAFMVILMISDKSHRR